MGVNNFVGNLPADIGQTLPNLQYLIVQANQFERPIPISLPNASELQVLDLAKNKFSGVVPPNLENFHICINSVSAGIIWWQMMLKIVDLSLL